MIPKSSPQFLEKIMLQTESQRGMTIQRNVIAF
jgi:hypothetical protein